MNIFNNWRGSENQEQMEFRGLEALRHYHENNFPQFHNTAQNFVKERERFQEIAKGHLNRTLEVSPDVDWNSEKKEWVKRKYTPIVDLQRAQKLKLQDKEKEKKLIDERDQLNLVARIVAFVEAFHVLPGKVEEEDKNCMKNFLMRHDNPEKLFAFNNKRVYTFMAELWEKEKKEELNRLVNAKDAYYSEAQNAIRDLEGEKLNEAKAKIHTNYPKDASVFDELGLSETNPALLEKYAALEQIKQEVRGHNIMLKLPQNEDIPEVALPPVHKTAPEKVTKENFCLRLFYGVGRFFQSIFNFIWKLFCCKKTA